MTVPAERAGLLRHVELTVTRRLDGMLQGDHRGLVPGHGSEPGETRPYVAGDDVRRIDWNVSARTPETQVRETIADRELETWLLVDRSPSLDFGTAATTKARVAFDAAAAIGFLTARGGNRVGAVIADGAGRRVVPARGGRRHLLALLDSVLAHGAADGPERIRGTGALSALLDGVAAPPRRRGMVVILSDFLDRGDWSAGVRRLTPRHDVIAIEVIDPRELELPAVGVLSVIDPETGRHREVATGAAVRARYAEAAERQRADIAARLRSAGADHLRLRTDRDPVHDLARFARSRRDPARRRGAARGTPAARRAGIGGSSAVRDAAGTIR